METNFQEIIEESRRSPKEDVWSGTCLDYLKLVKENPMIAQLAAGQGL